MRGIGIIQVATTTVVMVVLTKKVGRTPVKVAAITMRKIRKLLFKIKQLSPEATSNTLMASKTTMATRAATATAMKTATTRITTTTTTATTKTPPAARHLVEDYLMKFIRTKKGTTILEEKV